jgi:outer membrane biosynthesis protein TonB
MRLQSDHRLEGERRLPPSAVVGSVLVHGLLVVALLTASVSFAASPTPPETYRVRLVAAAAREAPQRLRPSPPEVAEEENKPPPPAPETKPEVKRPAIVEETPPAIPSTEPANAAEEGEEVVNVQLDGAVFAYPEYLDNIIRQILRYWRPPTDSRRLRAELVFVIEKDGSVEEIEWSQRSGDMAFDLEARGAIEAAGRAKAFGTLPGSFERLRVSFFFDPASL